MKSFFTTSLCFVIFCLFFIPGMVSADAGNGKSIMESRCTSCHGTGKINRADHSPEQWEKTVKRMMAKSRFGAQLSKSEMQSLLNHLNSL